MMTTFILHSFLIKKILFFFNMQFLTNTLKCIFCKIKRFIFKSQFAFIFRLSQKIKIILTHTLPPLNVLIKTVETIKNWSYNNNFSFLPSNLQSKTKTYLLQLQPLRTCWVHVVLQVKGLISLRYFFNKSNSKNKKNKQATNRRRNKIKNRTTNKHFFFKINSATTTQKTNTASQNACVCVCFTFFSFYVSQHNFKLV